MHIDIYKGSIWQSRVYGKIVNSMTIGSGVPKIKVSLSSGGSDYSFGFKDSGTNQ